MERAPKGLEFAAGFQAEHACFQRLETHLRFELPPLFAEERGKKCRQAESIFHGLDVERQGTFEFHFHASCRSWPEARNEPMEAERFPEPSKERAIALRQSEQNLARVDQEALC